MWVKKWKLFKVSLGKACSHGTKMCLYLTDYLVTLSDIEAILDFSINA